MLNFKQQEVLQNMIAQLQAQFSEVQLINVQELNGNSFWVSVTELPNEEKQFELDDVMAELSTDALLDYGFDFQFVPTNGMKAAA